MSNPKRVGKDLTNGPIFPLLLSFAIPLILTGLVQQLYSTVDLMIIGQYVGSVGTVGVATGGELIDLMTPFSMAIATGGQIYIAQVAGAKNEKKLKEAVGTLLTLMMLLAAATTLAALFFHQGILHIMNCPQEAWDQARNYMVITALGIPFVFGYNAISGVLRGMGESKRPLLFVSIAATINIFTDLLFVVVIPLEAAGTAIATVLSQVGSCVAAFLFLNKHRDAFDFELSTRFFRIHMDPLRKILRVGLPQLIRTFSVQGSMLWVKSSINVYGLVPSSTYSIGNKIEKFMNVFVQGVDNAAGAMIGQNLGAKKPERVGKTLWYTLASNMVVACVVIFIFLTFPKQLFAAFTTDVEVIEFGVTFLRIMSVGMIVVAFAGCFKSIATGVGDAFLCFLLGVLDGVCRILVCLLFFYVFDQGVQSYFWGAAFCMLLPGLISFFYFITGIWKKRKLLVES